MTASLDPIKIWISNLGVMIAVASAYVSGLTVSKVDIAPFEIEYGRGQSRIIHKSLRPSCFNTKESAANRVSFLMSRCTKFESSVLETMNEQKDPITVADAAINQLAILLVFSRPGDNTLTARKGPLSYPFGNP